MEVGTEEKIVDEGEEYDDCDEEAHDGQSNNDEADETIADEGEHQEARKSQWNEEVTRSIKVSPAWSYNNTLNYFHCHFHGL